VIDFDKVRPKHWEPRGAFGVRDIMPSIRAQLDAQIAAVTDPEAREALESIAQVLSILAGGSASAQSEAYNLHDPHDWRGRR
jgi:hypothetical protein